MDVSHFNIKTYSGIEYALLGFDKAVVIVFTYCPPKYAIVANFSKFLPVVIDEACQLVNNHRPGYMKLILMGDFNFQPDNPIAAQLFQSTFGLNSSSTPSPLTMALAWIIYTPTCLQDS